MSLFTAALAGAAQAGEQIVNKYIDEDLAAKRAQMMAELQRKSAGQMRQDEAAFSDQRAPIVRQQRVDDETAMGDVRNQTALRGDINRAQSQELLAAESKRADAAAATALRAKKAEASDTELTSATVAREKAILTGTMNEKAKAAGLLARATDLGGGVRAMQSELLRMDIGDKKRLGTLYDDYLKVTNSDMPDAEKAKKLAPITNAITALKSKNGVGGPGAGKDPEYDLVKVKEEEMLPGGGTRTTERTERRKAGAGGQPEDPYAVKPRGQQNGNDPYAKQPAATKPQNALMELAKRKAAQEAPRSEMETASADTLRRIAAIQGHAKQAAAKAELERRAVGQSEIDTSGFGYGGM